MHHYAQVEDPSKGNWPAYHNYQAVPLGLGTEALELGSASIAGATAAAIGRRTGWTWSSEGTESFQW